MAHHRLLRAVLIKSNDLRRDAVQRFQGGFMVLPQFGILQTLQDAPFGKSKENPSFQSRKIFSAVQSKNTLYICQHLALLIFGIIFTHILDWITE